MHDALLSGHLGTKKTREKTLQRFYWYEMRDDIKNWIMKCDICAANKKPNKNPRAPLGNMAVGAPLDRLATDILGPLPQTLRGNQYILVTTDHFTKWVEIYAVPDQTAETCAQKLLDEVISRFGCPLTIHSDQGRNYESEIFKKLCHILEIRKTRTSVRNPRCNGQVERFNRTLLRMIKAYLRGEQENWDLHLGCLAAAYRATPHESTGLTPNLLMLGREVRLPAELAFGYVQNKTRGNFTSYGEYVDLIRDRMHHAHQIARKHLQSAARRQKDLYDARVSQSTYQPGDLIWLIADSRKIDMSPKLQNMYDGPYVVKRTISCLNYMIQLDPYGKEKLVHHNKLKKYAGETPPRWTIKASKVAVLESRTIKEH
jgi:hypothetical protein